VRGAEAFDLLQALNTGHMGTLSTIHANTAEQALTRFAHCVLTTNVGLPHASTREAIGLAIHVVAHISRDAGARRVTHAIAVGGYDRDATRLPSSRSTRRRWADASPLALAPSFQYEPGFATVQALRCAPPAARGLRAWTAAPCRP
jgi:hypothetical protein